MEFETPEEKRKRLIKLIHIGRTEIGLSEDDYRNLLEGATGKNSCVNMNMLELESVLRIIKKHGFKVERKSPADGFASRAAIATIKKRWSYVARSKTEDSLNAFIKRITGVAHYRFLTSSDAQKVNIALNIMQKHRGI